MGQSKESSGVGCGTLSGWGALLSGIAAIVAIYVGQANQTNEESSRTINPPATQQIIKIYREILERDVDPSGMNTWTRELNAGRTILQVRRAIAESPEAQNKLNELYRRMLCRDIDLSGRATWTNALASGWTLQRVATEGIAPSPEYQSRGGRSCN